MMKANQLKASSFYLAENYETGRSCGKYSNKTSTECRTASDFAIFTPVFWIDVRPKEVSR
jgi:hypothetical protein